MLQIVRHKRTKFRESLAQALGVSIAYLRAIETDRKPLQPWMADIVQKHTNGKIKASRIYKDFAKYQQDKLQRSIHQMNN